MIRFTPQHSHAGSQVNTQISDRSPFCSLNATVTHTRSLARSLSLSRAAPAKHFYPQSSVNPLALKMTVPEIELIIKASTIDGRRKGACIFCQEYFMDLYLLAELKTISLKITTVDMKRPPPDFR